MTSQQIVRAWKDPAFRNTLGQAERELLPAHPAGLIELSDEELRPAAGGLAVEGHTDEQFCTTPCTMPAICPGTACCCWIAAVVYNEDLFFGPRVNLVRRWLINDYENTAVGRHVVGLYREHGERVAQVVQKSGLLKRVFKRLFDVALGKAEARYGAISAVE
jgi:mersacidin/lichenicidin family type 2 lantibiotic